MSLDVKIYSPDVIKPGYESSALVLPNEQGAAIDDYHGALASHLTHQACMRVVAFERPYSADKAVFNLGLRKRITEGEGYTRL